MEIVTTRQKTGADCIRFVTEEPVNATNKRDRWRTLYSYLVLLRICESKILLSSIQV